MLQLADRIFDSSGHPRPHGRGGAGVVTAPLLILFLSCAGGDCREHRVGLRRRWFQADRGFRYKLFVSRSPTASCLWMLLGRRPRRHPRFALLPSRRPTRSKVAALHCARLHHHLLLPVGSYSATFGPDAITRPTTDRTKWMGLITFPIAAEVGFLLFRKAGPPWETVALAWAHVSDRRPRVVGTEPYLWSCAFHRGDRAVHMIGGSYDSALLLKLGIGGPSSAPLPASGRRTAHTQPSTALRPIPLAHDDRLPICLFKQPTKSQTNPRGNRAGSVFATKALKGNWTGCPHVSAPAYVGR